ncbi:hypothetical protein JX265_010195 [Neoarthrinium moseri]|uniref:Large ribosomal subunit protein mL59 domain-containing protein n=1 Tax=Neoarthrinium moseri TaxID=1658444 RepID=A0A9P9WEQ4_9PEZI|nr:uncharacterized protein JN550_010436 [Neoarthrinium moseri]KAI1859746.1 hypothetical protein JX265_010195 [Neoarthrinium moseri]KAI1862133.1 hypothetical protein JN550_010436 [Neoarthrinium moseri]
MAAVANRYVELAKAIHPRLQRFLAKYPPTQILPVNTRANSLQAQEGAVPNPFLPHKHPVTGKWQEPEFSLRRQAELVKLAREAGVEELLPFTNKGTEERIRKRVEEGLRVKGTGVGQKVKGHHHERMLAPRMEKRRTAILGMPRLVREWRKTGTRKWTKFPSSPLITSHWATPLFVPPLDAALKTWFASPQKVCALFPSSDISLPSSFRVPESGAGAIRFMVT